MNDAHCPTCGCEGTVYEKEMIIESSSNNLTYTILPYVVVIFLIMWLVGL